MASADGSVNAPDGQAASVDEVLDLFRTYANDRYDEDVTQLDHALQTAAHARAAGADDALVAAALLHDVGHLLDLAQHGQRSTSTEDLGHEGRGARYLAALFPPSVTGPIALHVRAKRYRCAVDPEYHDGLSDGSRASLVLQGGPMAPDEAEQFAAGPAAAAAVELRSWDDAGKVDGTEAPPLDDYRALLESLALR
ncbi:MAG: HD domain-containing protein [Actinomycetes bacterium]